MIKLVSIIFIVTLFSACGSKSLQNQWKIKSINAFASYKINFLSSKDNLAKNDLNRAIGHAKVSADLTTLARVYLGECALNISVGIKDKCPSYKNIENLVANKSLDSYYNLLIGRLDKVDIKKLPNEYKKFTKSFMKKDYKEANEAILEMKKPTSKLIASAILEEKLSIKVLNNIIDLASSYGYKKSVIFFLKKLEYRSSNETQKRMINQKIKVLISK